MIIAKIQLVCIVLLSINTNGCNGFLPSAPKQSIEVSVQGNPNDDNHANQMNPNNDAYWDSRDIDGPDSDDDYGDYDDDGYAGDGSQADLDNHSNQMNPNNDAYWDSREK